MYVLDPEFSFSISEWATGASALPFLHPSFPPYQQFHESAALWKWLESPARNSLGIDEVITLY